MFNVFRKPTAISASPVPINLTTHRIELDELYRMHLSLFLRDGLLTRSNTKSDAEDEGEWG